MYTLQFLHNHQPNINNKWDLSSEGDFVFVEKQLLSIVDAKSMSEFSESEHIL